LFILDVAHLTKSLNRIGALMQGVVNSDGCKFRNYFFVHCVLIYMCLVAMLLLF